MAPPPVSKNAPRPSVPVRSSPVNSEPTPTASRPKPTGPVDGFESGPGRAPPQRIELPVSDAELSELRKQGRGELADTVRDAQKTYAGLIARGAKLNVTTSAGNNGHPVITVVPPALA